MTKSEFEDLLLRFSKMKCTKRENLQIQRWFNQIKLRGDFSLQPGERDAMELKILSKMLNRLER